MMRSRKLIPLMLIVLFLALTFVGAYYVRLRILEKYMAAAMEMEVMPTVVEIAHSFPCPVNARDKWGRTPLHLAAEWEDRALIEWLLRKGANVAARDVNGEQPLQTAAVSGGKEVVELLIAAGADFQTSSKTRCTPLHHAAANGRTEVVELLIVRGAGINAGDDDGVTPLHLAAHYGQRETVQLLLARGADINAGDNHGWKSLHWAAYGGRTGVAEFLIAKGANVNARDNVGRTPLHLAGSVGYEETVGLLIVKGADIEAKDGCGMTALREAIQEKHNAVADVLRKAGAKEAAKPPAKDMAEEKDPAYATDLSILKDAGLVGGEQRILQLHVEEEESDGFLSPWFIADILWPPHPIWGFDDASSVLKIADPLDAQLRSRQIQRLQQSDLFTKDGLDPTVRMAVTHRIRYVKGARTNPEPLMQVLNRWIFRVSALPAQLDILARTGGPRYGVVGHDVPQEGDVRFVRALAILGVKADGSVRVRYGDQEVELAPGKSWQAPAEGRKVPVADILKVTHWDETKGLNEKQVRAAKAFAKRILGDQTAIEFSTSVRIVNRGIVTARVMPAWEEEE